MQVFLSWSGKRSHAVAKVFNDWLPTVCLGVEPWISSEDIAKGADWVQSIQGALRGSEGVGLFFVTQEALHSQWFLFEAGSIAMLGHGRVCLVLVDKLPEGVLRPPLANYQGTNLDRTDVLALIQSLNEKAKPSMPEAALTKAFERGWSELEALVQQAIRDNPDAMAGQKRSPDDRLEDIAAATQRIEARLAHIEARGDYGGLENLGLGGGITSLRGGLLSGGPAFSTQEDFERLGELLETADTLIGQGSFEAYNELQSLRPSLLAAMEAPVDDATKFRVQAIINKMGPSTKIEKRPLTVGVTRRRSMP